MAFRLTSFVRCTNNATRTFKYIQSSRIAQQIVPASFFHTSQIRLNEHIINIQDEDDFKDRVLQSKTPVIVDFHASWCGPCKILGPRLESLVGAEEGKVILAKVDIDEMPDMAMEHGVQAVPTVLGMREGKVADKFVGLKDDDQLHSFIQNLAGK